MYKTGSVDLAREPKQSQRWKIEEDKQESTKRKKKVVIGRNVTVDKRNLSDLTWEVKQGCVSRP